MKLKANKGITKIKEYSETRWKINRLKNSLHTYQYSEWDWPGPLVCNCRQCPSDFIPINIVIIRSE